MSSQFKMIVGGVMYEVDVLTVEQLKFWILCLEQAIDEQELDVVFDRANELYSNGDNEHG